MPVLCPRIYPVTTTSIERSLVLVRSANDTSAVPFSDSRPEVLFVYSFSMHFYGVRGRPVT